ncbi:transposase [Chryseobacterium culicis]|uniref:transposase n=1 Tax=Chryseobacterium culicis TaxID=680127 RepID=UPI00289FA4B7|nr:transposase [Chryseobacterium culicis]
MDFKHIHIGKLIQQKVDELKIDSNRIGKFLQSSEEEIAAMYHSESIDSGMLLKWSKLLEYDLFRIYSQHLILYAPTSNENLKTEVLNKDLPQFRKKLYTRELIDFILSLIKENEKTKEQIIKEYRIPKTTLYKWIEKYGK